MSKRISQQPAPRLLKRGQITEASPSYAPHSHAPLHPVRINGSQRTMEPAFVPSLSLARRSAILALRNRHAPAVLHRRSPRLARILCTASPATSPAAATAEIPIGARMTSREIREAFLTFYQSRHHSRLPSASLVPDDPTIMLTIAGMVPFKPIFLGTSPPPNPPRATTSQKCIRTNDIENVGVTKRHHTFFEMLGNFSFGDYFKNDAIQWAWQLLTEVYSIPKERLAVSVYEDDDEALTIWRDVIGVPAERIQRLGTKDNFWASGPTGPCGPCSEIYFDFEPTSARPIDLEDDDRFIELYNLVFMQFSRDSSGQLTPLAAKNIDTGLGLERLAQVLQRVDTNYETDLILPIIDAVAKRAGLSFSSATSAQQTSLKVIGDHLRAIAHLVADGVRPSNVGRGYIVRRLIRRVVRHGRLLGIDGAFTAEILPVVAGLAKEAGLNSVIEKLDEIVTELQREEKRFLGTLERGEFVLEEVLEAVKEAGTATIPGEDAFELYDTFGFPLELTEEIAAENGYKVDIEGFQKCMEEQRTRARAARDTTEFDVETASLLSDAVSSAGPTDFRGYDSTIVENAQITALLVDSVPGLSEVAAEGDNVRILLEQSPFYAEGGGQVGDVGMLTAPEGAIRIDDTKKEAGAYVHVGQVVKGNVKIGDEVHAYVNASIRRKIMAHHTATHLLQAALKEVIPDGGISQAGSLVDADRLRFDFSCPRAVSSKELQSVEDLINRWIEDGHDTVVSRMTLEEAKEAGAVAMFGEKYDASEVRVVDVPGVSMELCGGTHVANTADIGLFKIVSESGPSSGVRRIEALCGSAVLPYLSVRDAAVKQLSTSLKARPEELPSRVATLQEDLKAKSKELDQALAALAVAKALSFTEQAEVIGDFSFIVAKVEGQISSDSLKAATESLAERSGPSSVVLLASENSGKVSFAAAVGKVAQKQGVMAGKLVGAVAKVCGGGGGGRPNFAQAGGRDATRLNDALGKAKALLTEALSMN